MKKGGNRGKIENPDRLNRLVSGTKITGDIQTESSLRIDGEVNGNVSSQGKLVLGESGIINGDIFALEVELDGTVNGLIEVDALLVLHKTAVIKGNVRTKRIIIEDGAHIEGNILTGNAVGGAMPPIEGKKLKRKEPDVVY